MRLAEHHQHTVLLKRHRASDVLAGIRRWRCSGRQREGCCWQEQRGALFPPSARLLLLSGDASIGEYRGPRQASLGPYHRGGPPIRARREAPQTALLACRVRHIASRHKENSRLWQSATCAGRSPEAHSYSDAHIGAVYPGIAGIVGPILCWWAAAGLTGSLLIGTRSQDLWGASRRHRVCRRGLRARLPLGLWGEALQSRIDWR